MPADFLSVRAHVSDGSTDWQLNHLKSVTLSETYTDPLGDYSFSAFVPGLPTLPDMEEYRHALKRGHSISFYIDGSLQAEGVIVSVNKTISNQGLEISGKAQTYLTNAMKGGIEVPIHVNSPSPVSFEKAVKRALKPYGFFTSEDDAIVIEDDSSYLKKRLGSGGRVVKMHGRYIGTIFTTIKLDDFQSKPDDEAYGYCQRMLSKLGLILKCSDEKTIIFSAPDYQTEPLYRVVVSPDPNKPGTRAEGRISYHEDNGPGYSKAILSHNPPSKKGETVHKVQVTGVSCADLTPDIRYQKYYSPIERLKHKPKIFKDKYCRDSAMAVNSAILQLQKGCEDNVAIGLTVQGFRANDSFWTVNTNVHLDIDILDIDEPWWIYQRTFTHDASGQHTTLKLLPKYALQLGDIAVAAQ